MKSLFKHKTKMLALSLFLMLTNINPMIVHAEPDDPVTEPENPGTTEPETPTEPENPGTTDPEPEEPQLPVYIPSSNNWLSSLSVEGVALNPAFSSEITEYTAVLSADITEITIAAEAEHYYASIDGTGTFEVSYESGDKDFKIICSAENGAEREYTLHVTFNSDPVLFTTLDGVELGFVIKDLDKLKAPDGFEMQDGEYQEKKITVFVHENFPFSLVYLQNSSKKADWYCYQDGVVTGMFRTLVINKNKYYYAGVNENIRSQEGYTYAELNVVGEKINGWKVKGANNENLVMLYLYDSVGNADYYIYNTDDQTLQNRREFEVGLSKNQKNPLFSPLTITAAIVVIIAAIFLFIIAGANNKRGIKETFKVLRHRLKNGIFPNKNKNHPDQSDVPVELVRTSKVRIFASPENEPSEKVPTKQTPKKEKIIKPKKEVPVEKAKKSEKADSQPIAEEKYTDEFAFEIKEILKNKETLPMEETPIVPVADLNNAAQPEKETVVKKTAEGKEKDKKKRFGLNKKKTKESKPAEKKKVTEAEPVLEIKDPVQTTDDLLSEPVIETKVIEEDPMTEIQKYIDQLFYLPENKEDKK